MRLLVAVEEVGSPSALALRVGTPKSHISALMAGTRGMGDALAEKIEKKLGKEPGWMDQPAGVDEIWGGIKARADRPHVKEPEPDYRVVFGAHAAPIVDLSDSDWALLEVFREFPPSRQQKILEKLREESAEFRELAEETLKRMTVNGEVNPVQPAIAPKPSRPPTRRGRLKSK